MRREGARRLIPHSSSLTPHASLLIWPTDPAGQWRVAMTAAATLRSGGLVVYPTDTVYGLGGDPRVPVAIQRIYQVKGRPDEKAIVWLLEALDSARAWCQVDVAAERLATRFWPGPLTLVLRRIDPRLGELPTLGVRVPAHPAALAIIRALGGPVATTSANRSGERSARTAVEADAQIGPTVDLIIDAGPAPGGTESTVVDLSVEPPQVLRVGALDPKEIAAALG